MMYYTVFSVRPNENNFCEVVDPMISFVHTCFALSSYTVDITAKLFYLSLPCFLDLINTPARHPASFLHCSQPNGEYGKDVNANFPGECLVVVACLAFLSVSIPCTCYPLRFYVVCPRKSEISTKCIDLFTVGFFVFVMDKH